MYQKEINDTDIIRTIRIWTLGGFLRNKNSVNIGDKVQLPAFKVSSAMIGGKNKMKFKKLEIEADYANVIDIRDNEIVLVFDHCLFANPMDYNNAENFEQTQIAKYLQKDFSNAMRKSGIPVKSCTLLSYEQLFNDSRLEYFKPARNRTASEFNETHTRCYWLEEGFLVADMGLTNCRRWNLDNNEIFVRPQFTISR